MATPENSREPCPDRILDDMGGAFGMGTIGGGLFHFLKGARNAPIGQRFYGGSEAIRMHAPRVGGSFAVWGGLFSVFDCSLVYLRKKEDPWNAIMAGGATGGLLSLRRGPFAVARSALFGCVLLAFIEGVSITVNRVMAGVQENNMPVYIENGQSDLDPEPGIVKSSWFGGLFGGGTEKKEDEMEVKDTVLESFDSPMPPTFEFK